MEQYYIVLYSLRNSRQTWFDLFTLIMKRNKMSRVSVRLFDYVKKEVIVYEFYMVSSQMVLWLLSLPKENVIFGLLSANFLHCLCIISILFTLTGWSDLAQRSEAKKRRTSFNIHKCIFSNNKSINLRKLTRCFIKL